VAFAVASVLASWPSGKPKEEEPLGIG
jgi:hypothetical protein